MTNNITNLSKDELALITGIVGEYLDSLELGCRDVPDRDGEITLLHSALIKMNVKFLLEQKQTL